MTVREWIGYARKALVAGVAALTVAGTAVADGSISQAEWVAIAIAGATAAGVYAVPNKKPGE